MTLRYVRNCLGRVHSGGDEETMKGDETLGYPVVHFEINSGAPVELQRFYAEAFDWSIDADNPEGYGDVKTEGVCPGSGSPGIDGGIGFSDEGDDFVTFYVQVPDVDAVLEKVNRLGGETVLGPTEAGQVVLALFRDPRGNRIGIVRAEPLAASRSGAEIESRGKGTTHSA